MTHFRYIFGTFLPLIAALTPSYNIAVAKSSPVEKVLVLPCVHCPYEHVPSMNTCLAFAKQWKPTQIVILGDFVDGEHVSSFTSHYYSMDMLEEFEHAISWLDKFGAVQSKIRYVKGNHDERYERPESVPKPLKRFLALERNLELGERKIKTFPYSNQKKDIYQVGDLRFMHGFHHNQHAAKTMSDRYNNVVFCHTHRIQIFTQPQIDRVTGWNIGMLGRKDLPYAIRRSTAGWENAFAFFYIYRNGSYSGHIAQLENEVVHINGKEYRNEAKVEKEWKTV